MNIHVLQNTNQTISNILRGQSSLVAILGLFMIGAPESQAADRKVVLEAERATSLDGAWQSIDPAAAERDDRGNLVVTTDLEQEYFRLRLSDLAGLGSGLAQPLEEVPPEALELARQHLAQFMEGTEDVGSEFGDAGWQEAALAPFAYPVFEPGVNEGVLPAYMEFKVISQAPPVEPSGGFLKNHPISNPEELGYILVSLTEEDFPVAEFSMTGPTTVEHLARLAGRGNFRPVRFGSTFLAAEDEEGRLIANFGTQPFKPGPAILEDVGQVKFSRGDDETEVHEESPMRDAEVSGYGDYGEFKTDYLSNSVYEHLRNRRARLAQIYWQALRGIPPESLEVAVGETLVHWPGVQVAEESLDVESGETIARITPAGRGGGLEVTGVKPGTGILRVVDPAGQAHQVLLQVTSTVPSGGLQTQAAITIHPPVYTYASSWAAGPKYDQYWSADFCPLSGCGPTAWSILYGWFEREHGIKGAFGNFLTLDAPYKNSDNFSLMKSVQGSLHEECDVICVPFSDLGATAPGDMFEGKHYLFIPVLSGLVKRSYNMSYDLWDDCPPHHGLICRSAIKKGYPAIIGLGWLWHYAVAYGYAFQKIEFGDSFSFGVRYVKCNMGWGPDVGPRWYNLCDSFWGGDFRVLNGPNAQ